MASQTTLLELAEAQRLLALVQAKKDAEDAAEAALTAAANATPASNRIKALAITLHGLLCAGSHDQGPGGCGFKVETADWDIPADANWDAKEHALWLSRARSGVKAMKDLGFTVTDPA
jgi:hypothetical protein